MHRRCQCDKNHSCDIWMDYQVSLHSLQEAEELSHQNWLEIQHLHNRIWQLEALIRVACLPVPEEPEEFSSLEKAGVWGRALQMPPAC